MDRTILEQLYIDVEVLKHEVTALRHISVILAARLCELSPESADRTKLLLTLLEPYADHADQPACGSAIKNFRQRVLALTEHAEPASALALVTLMAKDAGADRLDALSEWCAQATEEELVQDVLQLIEKVQSSRGSDSVE